jgi:hypothetical protein
VARDDFRVFDGSKHMFFGVREPFGMIRDEVEIAFKRQVPDSVIEHIGAYDKPKFLTIGMRTDDKKKVTVSAFGVCFRARIEVRFNAGADREVLDATLTFLFRGVDGPNLQSRMHLDLHADADQTFNDEAFEKRFLAFRAPGALEES